MYSFVKKTILNVINQKVFFRLNKRLKMALMVNGFKIM